MNALAAKLCEHIEAIVSEADRDPFQIL
jgi:Txe/YoeB family toxin of Txe-Axe toxin-antitoxin module